ncbi:hypothetical protein ACGFR6_35605 [Streptomyces sp. NPDC048567]
MTRPTERHIPHSQIERDVWLRGLAVLAVGAALGAVAALRLRRAG